jgi:hypothetical protein
MTIVQININIITDAGYTAVVYTQDKDATGKVIARKLDRYLCVDTVRVTSVE